MKAQPSIELRTAALVSSRCQTPMTNARVTLSGALEYVMGRYLKSIAVRVLSKASTNSNVIKAVLLKPVSDICNLQCTYCYEGEGTQRIVRRRMSETLLKRVIDTTLQQADGPIEFIWHGGEPLLAGIKTFQRGIEFQRESKFAKNTTYNSVQTNGILIDSEWIEFFKVNSFSVGISLDGPQDIHDQYRIDSHGSGSYSRVCAAIDHLRDERIPFGVITVIHPELVERAREYLSLMMSMGVKYIDVHPSYGGQHGGMSPLDSASFAHFCIALFEAWLEFGTADFRINLFDDFLRGYFFSTPETCYFAGTCSNIVAVEADGDVVPCTRPFDRYKYTFGTVGVSSIRHVANGERAVRFARLDRESQTESNHCPWYHLCHNGCPQHRVDTNGNHDVRGANMYCECRSGAAGGHRAIWSHIARRLNQVFLGETFQVDALTALNDSPAEVSK